MASFFCQRTLGPSFFLLIGDSPVPSSLYSRPLSFDETNANFFIRPSTGPMVRNLFPLQHRGRASVTVPGRLFLSLPPHSSGDFRMPLLCFSLSRQKLLGFLFPRQANFFSQNGHGSDVFLPPLRLPPPLSMDEIPLFQDFSPNIEIESPLSSLQGFSYGLSLAPKPRHGNNIVDSPFSSSCLDVVSSPRSRGMSAFPVMSPPFHFDRPFCSR